MTNDILSIRPDNTGKVYKTKTAEQEIKTRSGKMKRVKLSRAMAIKCQCMECMVWETNPKDCEITECPLYLYRGRTLLTNE
jgi:hypothetical protein